MVKTKRGKAKTPTKVVKEEKEVETVMKKTHPNGLFNHMCRSAMIRSPVAECSEGKAPYTVTITCYNKQLKVTFPEEVAKKGTALLFASHLLFKQFYEDYELPEEVQAFADTAAKPVAKSKYESDTKTHRMEKLGSFTADIKKVEDDAEMDADKREYKLYTFKKHQEKFVSVGTTVALPPFSEYILETEATPQKERGRDACREFTKACRVFNLDAAFEKHDPEITGNVIKNGCSVTVHKKAETEEGEMEFLFRLDHELEDTLPCWKQMLKDAKAGKPKPQMRGRDRSATVPKVRQGLCEMAIAKLIEDGIMEDENAVDRLLQERKEAAEAIRAEKAAEKEQRKAENQAAREKKQEEKEARKAEMEAKKAEKDRLKAERVAAHEARQAEAKRNKEQKQRNAQKNRQASPNKGQNNKGRNNQSGGANNNKNKPGQKRNWNQQSRNGGNNYSTGQPQQQWMQPQQTGQAWVQQPQQVWTQPMQQMGYQQPPAQPNWAAQQPATGASWGQPKRAKGDDGKMAQMIALQQQQMEQMRQMHEQQLAAMGNNGGTGSNW